MTDPQPGTVKVTDLADYQPIADKVHKAAQVKQGQESRGGPR